MACKDVFLVMIADGRNLDELVWVVPILCSEVLWNSLLV